MGSKILRGETFFTGETICDGAPVLIDDLDLSAKQDSALEACTAKVVKASYMSGTLLRALHRDACGAPTIVLYVGRSGQIVRSFLGSNCLLGKELEVHAVSWDRSGSQPLVTTSPIEWVPFIDTSIRRILVVDDVISTGTTLELLYARNAWRFPNAHWTAATWVTRKKTLAGYKNVYSAVLVTHPNGKRTPVVSLSTLCAQREIAKSFVEKNFFECDGKKLLRIFAAIAAKKLYPD